MFVFASVIQFGCGGTFYREVSVGENGKFGMTELVLFGTSTAYVASVATFSSGTLSEQPPPSFGYRHYRVCSLAISFTLYLDDGSLSFHCRFSLCVGACGSYCHGVWFGADVASEN